MKLPSIVVPLALVFIGCTQQGEVDLGHVLAEFNKQAATIKKIEYRAHRIDTFAGGRVWDNKGYALIERNHGDSVFGFSFYGKRDDVPAGHIYDGGFGFVVLQDSGSYRVFNTGYGFLGMPGGQMIVPQIFQLPEGYKTAELSSTPRHFVITYTFEDDTVYEVTNWVRVIELDKKTFLPVKLTEYKTKLGDRIVQQVLLGSVKVNDQVRASIAGHKYRLQGYKLVPSGAPKPSGLIGSAFPPLALPLLNGPNEVFRLKPGKVALVDIWEVWCGPCIRSLP